MALGIKIVGVEGVHPLEHFPVMIIHPVLASSFSMDKPLPGLKIAPRSVGAKAGDDQKICSNERQMSALIRQESWRRKGTRM